MQSQHEYYIILYSVGVLASHQREPARHVVKRCWLMATNNHRVIRALVYTCV